MTNTQWKTIAPLPAALFVAFGALGAAAVTVATPESPDAPQLGARCLFDDNLYGHSIVPPANGTYRQGLSSIRFASPELGGYCHL
ncbi:hypothetical protein MMAG44476_23289 [Mycolicibacterium mageritense DSM 44476 = CIP 104973]|uniref:DUF732 domain-containing protein n=1 Tax=Mycolicibacterium mageritense TaxID=53462 RepID=A0AAI8TVD1_MYCME|nr:hypothetical protein [Mycolicibacterium mageritense]MBN3457936.1 hypothetical protein [Mycobacterium sp. DSM 3803]OKH67853.1 hypothetical protein EB73_17340 [Mycobacterium sp. SWH-M3]MCC9179779.1 hypothetical protein [Mycolicibacterium mageritense]TXI61610.1 MAG: hypothetical protein E6Q55_15540 [Mycolicibacterium mageritense]CDO20787.1 hypothetical protein BN978_01245 [Mycolicibacterium mageritense DSM 44476 = CIP 104973]